jgi:hypothetical protein
MNHARILIGGLVAGVILNVGEFLLNGVVLAKQMEEFFVKCAMPRPGPRTFVILIVITFVLGIFIVYVYAAIRPRCGPGPKTAICAGVIAWFGVYLYGNIVAWALGFVPTNVMIIAIVWGFVEYAVAALAGGWLYREP